MAEYYSAELAEKVVRGMTENVLKGISNGGQITFGYKVNADRKFEPHETFAPILQEIFTMYADGRTIKYIVDYRVRFCGKSVHQKSIIRIIYLLQVSGSDLLFISGTNKQNGSCQI